MIGIKFGKIERETIHLCIDMQRIFLEPSPWFCPQGIEILEPILALIRHQPYNSWFSQFMTPNNSSEMENSWERYYEYWKPLTQDHLEKGMLDIHQGLFQESSTPQIFEKFSRFGSQKSGSAGLGLAICREILKRLEGYIYYLPDKRGAAFRVVVPNRIYSE